MRSLGRVFATTAGLMTLLAPSTAFASWWDGGYEHGTSWNDGYDSPSRAPVPPGPVDSIYGCENSTLPGTELSLHKVTTPPPGTPLRPGDEILVDITWRVTDWVGPDLHKAMDCVYINGGLVPELSGGERPTPNDGHFAYHYFVPLDVPPGSTICDQGFVSGPNGWDDYGRAVSDVVCFPVDSPPPPPPPPPAPAPPEETTTTTSEELEPYTESERFTQEVPPEEQIETLAPAAPIVQPRDVLPRTGADSGAAARLAVGALALAALAGRKARRRAHPARS